MRKFYTLSAVFLVAALLPSASLAATYHVGPGQTYATLNDLYASITPGDNDVILVHPGTYGTIAIYSGGGSSQETATIIRAYDMNNKPVFDASGADNCFKVEAGYAKWYYLDGLEIANAAYRGIFHVGGGLIVRRCYLRDCANGLMSGMYNTRDESPGYLIAEYNEFAYCGEGNFRHSCYIQEYWTEFRYNWIHEPASGLCYKDRSRDSLLEYNLIEQGPNGGYTIEFCGYDDDGMPDIGQTATMVGNVVTKNGGGNSWLFVGNERGEGGVSGGQNLGWLYLHNNTFYSENHTGPMLGTDDGSIIYAHNNIFHSATCDTMMEQVDYASSPGTMTGSYNWVKNGISVPSGLTDTVFGSTPGCVSVAWSGGDWHLNSNSPCVNAGYNAVDPAPVREYDHPCSYVNRYDDSALDIGAYEYVGGPVPLDANFVGNPTTAGPPPVTVDFTDLSTGYPTSWSWDFGDTGTSSAQNPSHTYTSIDTYTVSLTVNDGSTQDTETKVDYITITAAPSVVTVYPDSWETYGGDQSVTITSGSLADVDADDDVYMVAQCDTSSQKGSMEFHFYTGYSQSELSKIRVKYDLHGTNSSTPSYLFFMKQGDSSSFTVIYEGTYSTSDQVFTWETTDIATYLGSGGLLVTSLCGCPQNTTNYSTYLDVISIELELAGGGPVAPVADFSGNPTSGSVPLTVNFTDLSSNSPTSWSWDFGDTGTSTTQSPSHDYTSAGDYTVSLTATNSAGSDTETKTNYISVSTAPPPAPVADFSGNPTSGDAPLTVSFTDLSTNMPTSWSWSFGDTGSSTAQNPSHDYTSAGDYTVNLTATNAGGSDTETKTNYISVSIAPPPAPVADFSGTPTSGNAPLTVNFTDLSTNTPTSWSWSFGDTGSSTAQNPSHDYTSAGDYTVSLTATNAGGSDTETKIDYISVTSGGGPVSIFSDDFETGITGWSTSDVVEWYSGTPHNDLYSVRLRRDGAIQRTISTVGYTNLNVSFYLGAYSLDRSTEYAEAHWYDGSGWTLLKRINNGDPEEDRALHYFEYSLPASADGNASFALRFRIVASGTGDYGYVDDVVVQGSSGGGPAAPVADFSGSPTSGQAPLTVSFTDLSTNAPTSWSWDFGDTGTSTAQNPSHDYTSAGDYTVSLTATNAGGSDTETKTNYISVTSGGQQVTIFADHFENGLTGWTTVGGPSVCSCASEGDHMVRIRNDEAFERTISTVGYTSIVVEFDITATGLDGDDNVQALWYDGSTWTVMKQINDGDPDEDWDFDRYQFALPAGANNNANFALKFSISNCDGWDENGRVDDVKVLGTN